MAGEPIWDEFAERSVLGAVIGSQTAWDEVSGVLTRDDFYRPAHGHVWAAAAGLAQEGRPVDAVTVLGELMRTPGWVREFPGGGYLHDLIASVPTSAAVAYHAAIVAEKATLRRVVQAGRTIVQLAECGGAGVDASDVLGAVRREVDNATKSRGGAGMVPVGDAVWPFVDGLDAEPGGVVATPWPQLDDVLNGGLRVGELVYVAARTSVGKTVVAAAMARGAAQAGIPTAVCSLEMSRDELLARLVADVATVPLSSLLAHEVCPDDRDRCKRAADRIAAWPLWIDDSADVSVADIAARCRGLARQGLGLVVVDHTGLLRPVDARAARQEQVAHTSRDLKLLAKTHEVPVVACHQLNREPEKRSDGRPRLPDMRESGATEADADKVLLLWRPPDRPGELVVIVAKNRNGPTGDVVLAFSGRYARVRSGDPYRM
ncbi:MAG: replicative DNA helicase [Gammaproteobacteria bacterium]